MPICVSLLNFVGFLGGSAFVAVGQTLLQNKLRSGLGKIIPDFDPRTISDAGATSLQSLVSAAQLPAVLKVYNESMRSIWYLTIGFTFLVFVGSLGKEWKSVKEEEKETSTA